MSKSDGETFDYIVVGAGAAGSVVAARLAERGLGTICVLEAGPSDRSIYVQIPAGFIKTLFDPNYTWQFKTAPSPFVNNRQVMVTQGRVVGGSGSVNGMIYNRGIPNDYNAWAQQGNRGWGYDDVLPYFRKTERRIGYGDDAVRGRGGAVPITDMDWLNPVSEAFIAGAVGLGIPRNPDYNGGSQEGVGYFQRAIYGGRRVSSARALLIPALKTGPIHLKTEARACRILFDGARASGVEYLRERQGPTNAVYARKEVIVCAGSANTARLLQISGVGPAGLLKSLGVPVRHELRGVGENLKDHFSVRIVMQAKKGTVTLNELARGPRLAGQILRWLVGRPSILATVPSHVYAFLKSDDALDVPDLQFMFSPASYKEGRNYVFDDYPGMTAGVSPHRPQSSGWVRAVSTDVFVDPEIQPNYLKETADHRTIVAGLKLVRKLLSTPQLRPFVDKETLPGPASRSDDELLAFARQYAATGFHLVGTARMGPASDPMAVVDDELRVRGVSDLRIIDASVMPDITSGNTYAPTLMIAEKGADLVAAAGR
jgi:choline dehydrogenase